jgi:hypothetical protein
MAVEDTSHVVPPPNAPRRFPHPTNLILGSAFVGWLLLWWVLVHLLIAVLPGRENWALYLLAAILAAMIGTIAGVVVWARQVLDWARSVDAWKAELTQQVSAWKAEVEQRINKTKEVQITERTGPRRTV